ncbi:MAG: DUF4446 family protein [Candidatus Levyibacteriota bacterium]
MITYLIISILILWSAGLTVYILRLKKNYLTLTEGSNKKTLDIILTNLIHDQQKMKEDIAKLVARCAKIEKEEGYHIQKIGLLRFNPFKDTGGDQSFILVLVDAHNTGIIITALYSRTGTRWYTKRIVKGESSEHQLSDEEKKALHMAAQLK